MKTYIEVKTSERLPEKETNNESIELVGYTHNNYPILVFYDFVKEKWIDYDNGMVPISIDFWLEEITSPKPVDLRSELIKYEKYRNGSLSTNRLAVIDQYLECPDCNIRCNCTSHPCSCCRES